MARLESDAKAGFYPTPVIEMEHIIKRLSSQEEDLSLLDPCAGEGKPLKMVQDYLRDLGSESDTYGIELEKTRAKTASNHIDYVINCGYEESRMSHKAFSFMYLNPPFSSYQGERVERIFFRDLTKPNTYLTEGAIVVLNMPQYVLADMSNLIAQRLTDVNIYRFTDENFHTYNQVILYGRIRKRKGGRDHVLKSMVERYSYMSMENIPSLDIEDEVIYHIPKAEKDVVLFETNFVDKDDVLKSLKETNILNKFKEQTSNPKSDTVKASNPAMPLKASHMATAIASGALPEKMGNHLLVGVTKTKKTEESEIDEHGTEKKVETYQAESLIRLFTEVGVFDLE